MKSHLFVAAFAALVTAGLPGMAAAQVKPGAAPVPVQQTVDIRVCNSSGRPASVAISYVEVGSGRFINRGWYEVADGACKGLVTTDNSNFYMYGDAMDGSGRSWSGSHTLCVQYPGPYTFWSDGGTTCPSGYETRNFVPLRTDTAGTYTWTLNP